MKDIQEKAQELKLSIIESILKFKNETGVIPKIFIQQVPVSEKKCTGETGFNVIINLQL